MEYQPTSGRVRSFLAAPTFPGDEEKTRRAGLINGVLWAVLAICAVYGVMALFSGSFGFLPIFGAVLLLFVGAQVLVRRGYVQLAGALFSLILWAGFTFVLATHDVLTRGSAFGYLVLIAAAGLLMSRRGVVVIALLSIAATLGMDWAQNQGLLRPNTPAASAFTPAVALTIFALLMAALLYATLRSLDDAAERARRNEAATAESNRALQLARASLEERNEYLRTTVEQYDAHLAEVGRGNLSARLALDEQDGVGQEGAEDPLLMLGRRLNETTASLQHIIGQIQEAAGNLQQAASEILVATTQQVSGAREQSEVIGQMMTTVDEVKVIADQSVQRARNVSDDAQRAVNVSEAGQQSVQKSIDSMQEIKGQVEAIATNILALSERTQQIGEITATVGDLANQSNLLALNAAVEAARAGSQGTGFAVVAQEIRRLAQQSREATARVGDVLPEIQRATNATVMSTEEGMKGADAGVLLATQAGEAIQQLAQVIAESAQTAVQWTAAGGQQAAGIEQMAQFMQNINQAMTQNLSSTRQMERAAQDLDDLAGRLAEMVDRYQIQGP